MMGSRAPISTPRGPHHPWSGVRPFCRRDPMAVQLRCVDRGRTGWVCWVDSDGEKVVVRDAAGKPVGEFTPEEAAGHFQMPSFSENIKYLGIALGGAIHRFDVPKDGLRQIKALMNRSIASAGPEAVRSVKSRAI